MKILIFITNDVFNVYSINSEKVELVEDNLYIFESPDFYERLRNAVLREGSEQSFFEAAYKSFKDELNYKIIENYDTSFANPSDRNTRSFNK